MATGPPVRWALRYVGVSLAAALVVMPIAAEQAVQRVTVQDAIGTLPVDMSLCRQGGSTLETGVLGDLSWREPGPWGFGVQARVTGPPVAGGTLASYVDRRFIRANVEFIQDPEAAVGAYVAEFRSRIVHRVVVSSVAVGLVVGALVLLIARGRTGPRGRRRRLILGVGVLVGAFAASTALAGLLFQRWPCNSPPDEGFSFPGLPQLVFSSPQTRELALQVRPFLEKNRERIDRRAASFQAASEASFAEELLRRGDGLEPRDGEVIVSAEADPQGAFVGTAARKTLNRLLVEKLGSDAFAMRTISGDITSNGTVAEDEFVELEVEAGGELTTVAVSGDHDSEATQEQMKGHGMIVPDLETAKVGGLRVSGANDVEHKSLFGQLVSNESGLTEEDLGRSLREQVSPDDAGIVLLHQPDAVAGYLGVDGMTTVRSLRGSKTEPYDDGVPDVPPGTVNIGHLHDLDGPWVLWNTDGDEVTWTVVDQLGTTGGVEENSTFNRFSTPISVPLKPVAWRLQYFDVATGLQTGYVTISCSEQGSCQISERTDVGLPLSDR